MAVRGGAATVFYPMWHLEFENLVVLKNNRGVDDNRVRHMDYGVQVNTYLYKRLVDKKDITFFSPSEVPGLYKAFFDDQKEFARLYEMYEQDESIRKKTLTALEAFGILFQERSSTGRIYLQNVDNCNDQGPFIPKKAPIRQSNLCVEICLPTKPLEHIHDEKGEIALCTLWAINITAINSFKELMGIAEVGVRAIDALLDYQDYPVLAGKTSTDKYRNQGCGVINFAHFLARNGKKYSDGTANKITNRLFELLQYSLMRASCDLAKEQGKFEGWEDTRWSLGILPHERAKPKALEKFNYGFQMDANYQDDFYDPFLDATMKRSAVEWAGNWETLRKDMLHYGLRNATLTAMMPSETSSQISNATNGMEPPRGLVSVKQSKDGVLKQVVPEIELLADKYESPWESKRYNTGITEIFANMQIFTCQSGSLNFNYNPSHFEGDKVQLKQLFKEHLTAISLGIKTHYYHNTRDISGDNNADHSETAEPTPTVAEEVIVADDSGCESGACAI